MPHILEIKPGILLTDIKMPFMDGLELSKIIRDKLPHTVITILSGHNAQASGFNGQIVYLL